MDSSELKSWLALFTAPQVGPVRYISLVKHFGSPQKVLDARREELAELPDIGPVTASGIKSRISWEKAEEQAALMKKNGVGLLTFRDETYPENLLSIYDPPPFLFVQGETTKNDRNAVAIVGCRSASTYGKRITESIARELAKRGVTIVSGLARGIDSIGHVSALKEKGRTPTISPSSKAASLVTPNPRLPSSIPSQVPV